MCRKLLILLVSAFWVAGVLQAQDILKGRDLKQVRVDELSDGDIAKIKAQLSASGMSLEQAEPMVLSRGMSVTEFNKLKQRMQGSVSGASSRLKPGTTTPVSAERTYNGVDSLDTEKYGAKPAKPLINPLIFGSELYTSMAPSFEPNMKMATPANYIVGPDDALQLTIFGIQEYNGELVVSAEGNISVPNVGQIKVVGMTIEAVTQKIRNTLASSVYKTLQSGGSKMSLSLSKIRSIKVTVIGSNRPGTYNLSSLSTVFNALYVAGGPNANGSFREIELIRNNKVERKIDPDRVNDAGDYFEGSSYFNDILLDKRSTLKDKEFIILDIAPKIYETIKDKLPPNIILFPFDSGVTRIKIDYTKDLNIIDKKGMLNEIKVNPPPVLRFEINERRATVRDEFFGNLYLHGELLDDMAFLSLSKALVTSMPKEVYDRVKDQFPPYEVLDVLGTGQIEILFDDTKERIF
jgi:protein involved in polysaccharide export with SLBB domain